MSSLIDDALDLLRDCAVLSRAQEKLLSQSQDKSLDFVVQVHIFAIVSVLNLFSDLECPYTWRAALIIVAKAQGHGSTCACNIWTWVLDFV